MAFDSATQRKLIDLAQLDTRLLQLAHQQKALPILEEIRAGLEERKLLLVDLVAAQTLVDDIELEQARVESDLEPARARLVQDQERRDTGAVNDPKALTSLLEEIEHLTGRISDLEDVQLEVMERLEVASKDVAVMNEKKLELESQLRAKMADRDQQLAEIQADREQVTAKRETLVEGIPPELVTRYDKIAARAGGTGAAELVAKRCSGCQIELNASDLRDIAVASETAVVTCDECGRILVRTDRSGI